MTDPFFYHRAHTLAGMVVVFGAFLFAGACGNNTIAEGSVDGTKIYLTACARCHGDNGVPGNAMASRTGAKPIHRAALKDVSDEDIRLKILRGSTNKMMPAFKGALTDAQITALVAYLRTLEE